MWATDYWYILNNKEILSLAIAARDVTNFRSYLTANITN